MTGEAPASPLISGRFLANVQAISGLCFSTFLSLHLTNTALANLGPSAYDAAQAVFRNYYHAPLVEYGILGGSLVAHVTSSAILYLRKKSAAAKAAAARKKSDDDHPIAAVDSKKDASTGTWDGVGRSLHRYTGFILTAFIPGHVLATRFVPSVLYPIVSKNAASPFADFTTVTYSVQEAFGWGFSIYYVVLALSGLFHMSYGIFKAIGTLSPSAKKNGVFKALWNGKTLQRMLLFGAAAVIVSGVFAISGFYFDVPIPRADLYHEVEANLFALIKGLYTQ